MESYDGMIFERKNQRTTHLFLGKELILHHIGTPDFEDKHGGGNEGK